MTCKDELKSAMNWLASKPDTLFIGQSVGCAGTSMSASFADIDPARRIEFPVSEELQAGVCIGLSLTGYVPVCVYPRWNFALLAANQLVNHLDRLPLYSGYKPKVIIRTAVGASKPLDPGPQHQDDFTQAFQAMLKTVRVIRVLKDAPQITYQSAYEGEWSTIVVEG